MRKRLWKCVEGIDIYGYIDDTNWHSCKLLNPIKSLFGKGMDDLKNKIERYIEKDLGLKIQYIHTIDKFPKPLPENSPKKIKEKAQLARVQRMQIAILERRRKGQYEIISHYWSDHFLKDIFIDLVHQKIYYHPSGLVFDTLALEIARTFPFYIAGLHPRQDKLNSKIIGVNSEGGEELCELRIAEDRKSFKLKQDLKIIKPGYFKYFQSNTGYIKEIIDYSYYEKFPELPQLHLDIS